MSEIRDFHPLVADWLTTNGYTHKHHVKLPLGGTADFVATKDGQTFVVECKIGVPNYRAIVQTLDYCSQIDGALPMIFANETSESFERMCQNKGIPFHVLDMPYDPENRGGTDAAWEQVFNRLKLKSRFQTDMIALMREVIELHDSISSCAIKDLWELCMRTNNDAPIVFIDDYIRTHPEYEDICDTYLSAMRTGGVDMYSLLPHIYVAGKVDKGIVSNQKPRPSVKMRHFYKHFDTLPPSQTGNLCGFDGYPYNFTTFISGIDSVAVGLFDDVFTQETINRVLDLIPYHTALMSENERDLVGDYNAAVIILPYSEYRRVVDTPNLAEVYSLDERIILYGARFDRDGKMQIMGGFWAVQP